MSSVVDAAGKMLPLPNMRRSQSRLRGRKGPQWVENVKPHARRYNAEGKRAHERAKKGSEQIAEGAELARKLRQSVEAEYALITDDAGNPFAIGIFGPSVPTGRDTARLARSAASKLTAGAKNVAASLDAIGEVQKIRGTGKASASGRRSTGGAAPRNARSSTRGGGSTGGGSRSRSRSTETTTPTEKKIRRSGRLRRAASPGRATNAAALRELPMSQLWSLAKKNGLTGYNRLKKDELVRKLARKINAGQRGRASGNG